MDVIYLAGGIGKRVKLGYPKQFAYLAGKPIIIHALEILEKIPKIDKIIIPSSDILRTLHLIKEYSITKAEVIEGGKTRQESTKIGLSCVESEFVLIMEAVRPFVTKKFIQYVMNKPGYFVTPVERPVCSVLTSDGNYIDRKKIGEVQMPQKYNTEALKKAHEKTKLQNASDDAVIMIDQKYVPLWVTPLEGNIKITSPLDLIIAEAIYENNYNRE